MKETMFIHTDALQNHPRCFNDRMYPLAMPTTSEMMPHTTKQRLADPASWAIIRVCPSWTTATLINIWKDCRTLMK
jgi:hypothetical protein